MIHFKKGYKYQLARSWKWKLKNSFTITSDYQNRYYWISKKRQEIGAYIGCAWDGASGGFPDFDWIMEGSLGHDILTWLGEKGIIPESENHLIDAELEEIVKAYGEEVAAMKKKKQSKWIVKAKCKLIKFRAWYAKKGTGLVDYKKGRSKPVITIPR